MQAFSWQNTIVLVNGVPIGGWEDSEDALTMERFEDSAKHIMTADGKMVVNYSANMSGFVQMKIKQSDPSNAYLSGLINVQESGVFTPVFVQYKDLGGLDLGAGTQGYIPKPASIIRGNGINTNVWRIHVERLDLLHGGAT